MQEHPKKQRSEGRSTSLAERTLLISNFFRIETSGLENLENIPPEKYRIYVTSHLSNYDIPNAIAALSQAGIKNLKLMEAGAHEDITQNPFGFFERKFLVGEENSLSISSMKGRSQDGIGIFNPDDYEPVKKALLDGYGVVVAAYYDPEYKEKWRLPRKGGYAAAYLANIAENAVLIPIAVDIQSKEPLGAGDTGVMGIIKENRPRARVIVGKPIEPAHTEHMSKLSNLVKKHGDPSKKASEETYEEFKRLSTALRSESARIMQSLSELLPEEKRAKKMGTPTESS